MAASRTRQLHPSVPRRPAPPTLVLIRGGADAPVPAPERRRFGLARRLAGSIRSALGNLSVVMPCEGWQSDI